MFGLPAWLLVFPVLGFLIFIHELGHFATAKWFGITVKEFGFGFPPRLFGVKFSKYGTIYSVNLVPLGGFVRMVGEHGEEIESGALVGQKPEKNVISVNLKKKDAQGILTPPNEMEPPVEVNFGNQSVLKRTIVLSAGAFMNLLFPFVAFAVMAVIPHDIVVGEVVVTQVRAGSPAEEIGLRSSDIIVGLNGATINNTGDLLQIIERRRGTPTEIEVKRAILISGSTSPAGYRPETETFTVTPRKNPPALTIVQEVSDPTREISLADARRNGNEVELGQEVQQGAIGVGIILNNPQIAKESTSITKAIPLSLQQMWDVVAFTRNAVGRWVGGGPNPGFTGPVGIAQVTGEIAKTGRIGLVINLMALISISLGVVNILPIPALDGGRLLFVIIEGIRRGKRISPESEGKVHLVGFVMLIGLIVVISYFDVIRLLNGGNPLR